MNEQKITQWNANVSLYPTKNVETITNPLCVYCNKPWSIDMVKLLDVSTDWCVSGGVYGSRATLDITCDGCGKLIYRKEFEDFHDNR